MDGSVLAYLRYVWSWRNVIIAIVTPLLLLPLTICFQDEFDKPMKCCFVIAAMVIYWSFECVPIAVTALLPMVLYPLLRIVRASELAPLYMQETNMAFLASMIVVAAFERADLHKGLALGVLKVMGVQQRWLLLGFMIVAWFLSMWMQNTMTTCLLVPIVSQVADELSLAIAIKRQETAGSVQNGAAAKPAANTESIDAIHTRYRKMLLISVAYSCSIGGVATVLGTPPNLILKQLVDETYEEKGCTSPVNFLSWMIFGLPTSAIFLVLGWLWLLTYFSGPLYTFGCRRSPLDEHKEHVTRVVNQMYNALPPLGCRQWVALGHITAMILLMLTRQMDTKTDAATGESTSVGWEILAEGYVKESTAAVLVVFVLFVFPLSIPKSKPDGSWTDPKTSLRWSDCEKAVPFEVLLLLGGGMAAESGLAHLLSELLNELTQSLSDEETVCIVAVFVVFATEIMSNTACVTLMLPVLLELAEQRETNPLFFMFPCAVSASFAFMFPVATPPNSIVFSAGKLRIIDMFGAGLLMNIIGIGVTVMATVTYGKEYFKFDKMPWNMTTLPNGTEVYVCLDL